MVPRATYRLQFHEGFRFADAARLAPYLARLGISHVYASPYMKARPGSTHGYDIVDHRSLNPELGDQTDFDRMVAAFAENGLGHILDFVPNHIGIGGADNPLWLDVLEWGQESEYAGWFDIDWQPDHAYLRGKLLVPFLGEQYGIELQAGNLALRFDRANGDFAVWAYERHNLPICPLHYARILGDAHAELERMGDAFAGLPDWRPQIVRRAAELKAELGRLARDDGVQQAIDAAVSRLNGDRAMLDALIRDQHWRAAHFRVAADDINYRRFFDINDLAGLRMELPQLFEHVHTLVLRLLKKGTLDGLRIDHIDGLFDPKAYLKELRRQTARPFYLVVEKILAHHEALREDWPVDGTTGYDFANLVLALLVDPAAEDGLTRAYVEFTGEQRSFAEIVRASKIRIMENEMASELNVLARDGARVARQNPRSADFTQNILQRAIKAVVACFPVYRTYVDGSAAPADTDRRDLDWAFGQARRYETDIDPSVFDFLHALASTDLVAAPRSGFSRHSVVRFAMKLQQYSGPVMAKGLEDTAFYRYNRFLALNEVGGNPDRLGLTLPAFHRANALRARDWPHTMLATSTHDTKHGEDSRARLAVLADIPDEWARQAVAWSRVLRAARADVEGDGLPDRNDEYAFYQLLLGSWPAELIGPDEPSPDILAAYSERLVQVLRKSLREAKLRTTWAMPDEEYERGVLAFVEAALDPSRSGAFLTLFRPFAERVARLGIRNSLVQTVLKLTLPGMPDFYQGSELWDLNLVDPDNRRPVDYPLREKALAEVIDALARNPCGTMRRLAEAWPDGRIKLAVITTLLEYRRGHPDLFADGSYEPVVVEGARGDRLCCFVRQREDAAVLVAASRFPGASEGADPSADDTVPIPACLQKARLWELLTGRAVSVANGRVAARRLFADLPVAVLVPA